MSFLNSRFFAFVFVLATALVAPIYSQTTEYALSPESNLYVDGTSNGTPEWRVYATQIDGSVSVNEEGNVAAVQLVVPSKMMKSRKSPIMDRGMYGALKANEYPEIVYELASVSDFSASDDGTFTLNSTGNLTITATTNEILIPVEGANQEDGSIHFKGTHSILMTDYGVQPPSMMFGAYRTGDELVITFELIAVPAE